MRTLFYEFPEDEKCWEVADEFLFGGDILVAPVLAAGQRERSVYLPAGANWELLWNGEVYEGGREVTVPAPLAQTPVFLRDGRPECLKG